MIAYFFLIFFSCFGTGSKKTDIESVTVQDERDVTSRGSRLKYKKPKKNVPINLHVISVGTSEYVGDALDLNYAEKDAHEFANTMDIIASSKIFSKKDIQILTTAEGDTAPNKENIKKAFEKLKESRPDDLVVVYLAGHGVNITDTRDNYLYVTMYTSALAQLEDPTAQKTNAISSAELRDWMKAIPANKKVLILDTCAAGAAAETLSQRKISAEHLATLQRAVKKLHDTEGTFILMGSAANKESYEASRYGHSLLTYAFLEGIKAGGGLHNDNTVYVGEIFRYVQDRVVVLARGIGGVQEPLVAIPKGQEFPLGWVDTKAQEDIRLNHIKPQITRPEFYDAEQIVDVLNLSGEVSRSLRAAMDADLVLFNDVPISPNSCSVSGEYRISETIQLDLYLEHSKNKSFQKKKSIQIPKAEVSGLADQIVDILLKECPSDL